METKAYILIETTVGKQREVVGKLRALPGVETAEAVTGPYDAIAVVGGPDTEAVGRLVTGKAHAIDGVVRTMTCLILETP